MILRYIVETNHCKTFTASKEVKDINHAKKIIEKLKNINKKSGYIKYGRFILYSDSKDCTGCNCAVNPDIPENR